MKMSTIIAKNEVRRQSKNKEQTLIAVRVRDVTEVNTILRIGDQTLTVSTPQLLKGYAQAEDLILDTSLDEDTDVQADKVSVR